MPSDDPTQRIKALEKALSQVTGLMLDLNVRCHAAERLAVSTAIVFALKTVDPVLIGEQIRRLALDSITGVDATEMDTPVEEALEFILAKLESGIGSVLKSGD